MNRDEVFRVAFTTPAPDDYAGWAKPPPHDLVDVGDRTDPWWSRLSNVEAFESIPSILRMTPRLPEDLSIRSEPDWFYRVSYITGDLASPESHCLELELHPSMERDEAQAAVTDAHHELYNSGSGRQIVGVNNLGELRFDWNEQEHSVTQKLWWRIDTEDLTSFAYPMTTYRASLDPDPKFPPSVLS